MVVNPELSNWLGIVLVWGNNKFHRNSKTAKTFLEWVTIAGEIVVLSGVVLISRLFVCTKSRSYFHFCPRPLFEHLSIRQAVHPHTNAHSMI